MTLPICHSVGAPGARTPAQNGVVRLKLPRSLHDAVQRPETMKTRAGSDAYPGTFRGTIMIFFGTVQEAGDCDSIISLPSNSEIQ